MLVVQVVEEPTRSDHVGAIAPPAVGTRPHHVRAVDDHHRAIVARTDGFGTKVRSSGGRHLR
ncbi:MAG: hypothetical protein EA389_09910 [Ilumatobacter sp.]|nr:MAG: hypothetical protein EA389_09910 [Ilumatobacter sp.]